ncbi:hypothetical protein PVAP13_5NG373881 [Panicum virgatum]|uniref:Uncharacterized protein n=1 Tax=Panicum virgatum TaxID=38727 RepID=A0A8T0RTG7_PANVG|nr:hypothetical protein PVAP13_5NG373881 [Panicum virgatum]
MSSSPFSPREEKQRRRSEGTNRKRATGAIRGSPPRDPTGVLLPSAADTATPPAGRRTDSDPIRRPPRQRRRNRSAHHREREGPGGKEDHMSKSTHAHRHRGARPEEGPETLQIGNE